MYPKIIVIIPTYNEAENIQILINKILSINPDLDILVVDDNSPDGTGDVVSRMADANRHIAVLHHKKGLGRGEAVIAGLKYAVDKDYACAVEMDADFSHDPVYIPDLLEMAKDSDVVLGSRYIKGGSDCRGPARRLLSRIAATYIRSFLGIKLMDPASGYRCFNSDILKKINLDTISARGQFIVTEILYRCCNARAIIREIPIRFIDRKRGSSKLNFKMLILNLWDVLRLSI